jgi:hypothetical protein
VALRRLPIVAFYGPSVAARNGSISSVLTDRRKRLQTLHAVVIAGWIGGV